MNEYTDLKYVLPVLCIIVIAFLVYNWRRRWLYYYGARLPGPFAFPIFGSIHLVKDGPHGVYKFLKTLFQNYPNVFKIWLGPHLYVSTTEPKHLKILLTTFLDKGNFYHLMSEYFRRALAAAPVDLWKKNRKNINPAFNVTLIASFVDSFVRHANILADDLEKGCGKESEDIFPAVWRSTLDAGCETLADADPKLVRSQDYMPAVFRIEDILLQRFFNPILHLDIFWNISPMKRELRSLFKQNCSCMEKIIDCMKPPEKSRDPDSENVSEKKRFLKYLVDGEHKKELSRDYILEESQIMFFVGTETSAVAMSSVLVVLGMYPDVQDKIDEELASIFGNSDRDPTLEDVNRMEYLERVIKETLRLLPPIPFIMRTVESNIQLDSYVFPKGARLIVPIAMVHRKPELWPDPLKFDPDRFLPEEIEKRPPCSFIAFSYGIRNCIGYKYGLLSMKVIISILLRRFRVKSSNYASTEDMDLLLHVVAKAKNGYKLTLERKK